MKNLIFTIFILSTSLSFAQKRYDYYNSDVKKSKGMIRVSKEGELLTGVVFGNFNNGKLEFEENYKDGLKNGFDRQWTKNGQLVYERSYINGKRNGTYKDWDKKGQLRWEKEYENGLKNGIEKFIE